MKTTDISRSKVCSLSLTHTPEYPGFLGALYSCLMRLLGSLEGRKNLENKLVNNNDHLFSFTFFQNQLTPTCAVEMPKPRNQNKPTTNGQKPRSFVMCRLTNPLASWLHEHIMDRSLLLTRAYCLSLFCGCVPPVSFAMAAILNPLGANTTQGNITSLMASEPNPFTVLWYNNKQVAS